MDTDTHPPIWIDWAEIEGPISKNHVPESTITRVEAEQVINPKQEKFIREKEKWFERFRQWQKGVDAVVNTPEKPGDHRGDCQDGQKNTSTSSILQHCRSVERHTGCKGFWVQ